MKVTKLHPESKDRVLELLQESIDKIDEFHVVVRMKDGTYEWLTTEGEDKFRTVGALEYLKSKLLNNT